MRPIVNSSKILPGAIPHPTPLEAPVTPAARREYVRTLRPRYTLAPRRAKPAILDEFCATTGYTRKYAISLLNCPPPPTAHHRLAQALRALDAYFERRKPAWDEIINQPAEV